MIGGKILWNYFSKKKKKQKTKQLLLEAFNKQRVVLDNIWCSWNFKNIEI